MKLRDVANGRQITHRGHFIAAGSTREIGCLTDQFIRIGMEFAGRFGLALSKCTVLRRTRRLHKCGYQCHRRILAAGALHHRQITVLRASQINRGMLPERDRLGRFRTMVRFKESRMRTCVAGVVSEQFRGSLDVVASHRYEPAQVRQARLGTDIAHEWLGSISRRGRRVVIATTSLRLREIQQSDRERFRAVDGTFVDGGLRVFQRSGPLLTLGSDRGNRAQRHRTIAARVVGSRRQLECLGDILIGGVDVIKRLKNLASIEPDSPLLLIESTLVSFRRIDGAERRNNAQTIVEMAHRTNTVAGVERQYVVDVGNSQLGIGTRARVADRGGNRAGRVQRRGPVRVAGLQLPGEHLYQSPHFDCVIVEFHHPYTVDFPSQLRIQVGRTSISVSAPRPRGAVIDDAWRSAMTLECEPLCARDGGPLARAVKCIIDPLILRLRANRELGRPILDADAAARVTELIVDAAPTLAACAQWFTELKQARRIAGITGGNIQEQYFPRAYELAVQYGAPADDSSTVAAEMLAEIHEPSAGKSLDDLTTYLDGNEVELDRRLDAVWASAKRAATATDNSTDLAGWFADLLDTNVPVAQRDRQWKALASSTSPGVVGGELFESTSAIANLLAAVGVSTDHVGIGLSAATPASRPPLRGRLGTLPLDRSISTRVTATLRRSREREQLSDLADLIDDEINRSRRPWALESAVWQAAMMVGVVIAVQLNPLAPQDSPHSFVEAMSRRLAAQAHVLYNRRLLLKSVGESPAAAGLREFWRPYLSRLWVRLHGRDVTDPGADATSFDAEALLDLMDGIARSVSFDQRSRIRAAIGKAAQ